MGHARLDISGFPMFCCLLLLGMHLQGRTAHAQAADAGISKAAALSCQAKVLQLEKFDTEYQPGKHQTTRISQNELNSYLALILSPDYHPCLKSLVFRFENGSMQADAMIDFDRLQFSSTQAVYSLLRSMLSGTHSLAIAGELISGDGKASFKLREARFDSLSLPNILVSEIISAVGRRQNPPFDPMQPSTLPYRIQKAEVQAGMLLIYQ